MRKATQLKSGLAQVRRYGGQERLAGFGQGDVVGEEGEVNHITSIPRGYTQKLGEDRVASGIRKVATPRILSSSQFGH